MTAIIWSRPVVGDTNRNVSYGEATLMPVPQRDLALTRKQLTDWLRSRLPEAGELHVSELTGPGSTGFSTDTLLLDLTWTEGSREHREELVARVAPTGRAVFPDYDLGRQFRLIHALEACIPVPKTRWLEEDETVLGQPFFVMEQIDGRAAPDSPPYHAEGWVTELSPEQRREMWWSGLDVLTTISRLDPASLGLGFLAEPEPGRNPPRQTLAFYEGYLDWVQEQVELPTSAAALEWLRGRQPAGPEPLGLCWGDSRLGNMLFRDQRCVAVLDWEMATLANPEADLAWWLFFDRHHSEGCDAPRLDGFPGRSETIERYEERVGRPVEHLEYYEVFAAFCFSVIMARVAQQLKSYQLMPEEADFDVNNPCSRLLAVMLELPPPGS
jgi:aminoglycoside phosphotransferase (APT) family kinase protein